MSTNSKLNMNIFADHIIALAQENHFPITNLHLQKFMYFTLKLAKEETLLDEELLRKMYDEQFEVWTYGPVVRRQYSRFKRFASEFILGDFEKNTTLTPLNPIILELFQVNVFTLVELSTRIPFWIENHDKIKDGISDIKYDFDDI
jgi:hypothetical protein